MALIKVTPQELRDASSDIATRKGNIISLIESLNSLINSVAGNWEGSSQAAFLEQFNQLYPKLHDDVPQVLEGISSELNRAADAMEETDEKIANTFRGQ